jgi:hypothetical protein
MIVIFKDTDSSIRVNHDNNEVVEVIVLLDVDEENRSDWSVGTSEIRDDGI